MKEYMSTAPKKRPSAETKKSMKKKKPKEDEEEEEEEEEEEDESEEEYEAVVKAKPAAKTKAKSVSAASIGKPITLKRPAAIAAASPGKFPRIDRNDSVYWGGGRVYLASGSMVRVYARQDDRNDKRMKYKDEASLRVVWEKACNIIATDPRPRNAD
jgi:hypothetical protein